ncbi:MAG: MFS transporter [Haloplanus sp.]
MSRKRLFSSLCVLVFLLNLARVVYAPLLDVFIREFSIGEATAGLIVTVTWIGSAAPSLPTGWLLTKVPRHPVIVGSGAVLSLSAGIAATATTVPRLMGGAFLMGIGSGVYFVSAHPFLSELYPKRVGRMMGIHGASSQLAAVAAAPFVALALRINWRTSLWTISGLAALATVYAAYSSRRTELPRAGTADRRFVAGAFSEWRLVVTALAIGGFSMFVWQGLFNFYELYMQSKALSGQEAGALLTLVFVAGVPAFYVGGNLAERFSRVPYILGIVGSFSVCVYLVTVVDGLFLLVLLTTCVGFFAHALYPAVDTYLLDALPDRSRASAYAVFSSTAMVTQALGSAVVGWLVESGYSYDQVFGVAALLLLVTTGCLGSLERMDRLPA